MWRELLALAPLVQAGLWCGRHQDYQGRKSSTGRDGWQPRRDTADRSLVVVDSHLLMQWSPSVVVSA